MPARLFNEILTHTLQHSFVQVESNETKLYIDQSGSSKRTGQLHPIALRIHRERNGKDMVLNGADRVVCRRNLSDSFLQTGRQKSP